MFWGNKKGHKREIGVWKLGGGYLQFKIVRLRQELLKRLEEGEGGSQKEGYVRKGYSRQGGQ